MSSSGSPPRPGGQRGKKPYLKVLAVEFASAEAAEVLRKVAEEGVYLILGRGYRQAASDPRAGPYTARARRRIERCTVDINKGPGRSSPSRWTDYAML
ncbi:MAG: hypothetical protein QXK11_09775 [Pyrobaculum sp.]|uniref:Uncharacterized protein n=1 Tax=Pyrobaculum arsenaticum (strain DSM 13514 / JCM 11321 / PZ6) TaxID=340102 RepID=A4WK12_PYRAR|nr:hypothetical protein Pars_1158 [Pyrobaculum arsenaticum DSM 13514]